jgi:two-component system response regulator PilR (NtrC family)
MVTPARILIIDDDREMRAVLSDILLSAGCGVDEAGNGGEGLNNYSVADYDIVISDLGMETGTGWDIARMVKEGSPTTVVALITGWGSQIDERLARSRGVDFVLSKPFRIEDVKKLVNQAMSVRRKTAEG